MDHLLNGAAAIEGNNNSSSSSSSSTGNSSGENSPKREDHATAGAYKYLRTEKGAVRMPVSVAAPSPDADAAASTTSSNSSERRLLRELKPLQPAPKLPPISSLTHAHLFAPAFPSQMASSHMSGGTSGSSSHSHSHSPPPPPAPQATHGVQSEHLCRYRNKLCLHSRAVKRNGEMHNLCEKHRSKANQNQRKLESKRRVQKRHTLLAGAPPPRTYQLTPTGPYLMVEDAVAGMQQLHHPPPPQLAPFNPRLAPRHHHPMPSPPPPPSYEGNYPPYSR